MCSGLQQLLVLAIQGLPYAGYEEFIAMQLAPQDNGWFLRNNALFITNVVFSTACLASALVADVLYGIRIARTLLQGKIWCEQRPTPSSTPSYRASSW